MLCYLLMNLLNLAYRVERMLSKCPMTETLHSIHDQDKHTIIMLSKDASF